VFDYYCHEGPLKLIYQGKEDYFQQKDRWKLETLIATPVTAFAVYSLQAQYWWIYPLIWALPVKDLLRAVQFHFVNFRTEIYRMWLMRNGDQVVVQTYDKIMHKLNVYDNLDYEMVERKKDTIFVITNSGREYLISLNRSVHIDYDIIDRIMKGTSIDTQRSRNGYNRLIFRAMPPNLRPSQVNRFAPQFTDLKATATLWHILNRTIYRGGPLLSFKRKVDKKGDKTIKEAHADEQLKKEFNLRVMPLEEEFYKIMKLTKTDFLDALRERKLDLLDYFSAERDKGRLGVLSLEETKKAMREKQDWRRRARKGSGVDFG